MVSLSVYWHSHRFIQLLIEYKFVECLQCASHGELANTKEKNSNKNYKEMLKGTHSLVGKE